MAQIPKTLGFGGSHLDQFSVTNLRLILISIVVDLAAIKDAADQTAQNAVVLTTTVE